MQYDGAIALNDLNDHFYQYYEMLGPFGHGNPQPLFKIQQVEVIRTYPIKAGHSRGVFRDKYGDTFDFIAFNRVMDLHSVWDIAAQPQINEYYGEKRRQLQVIDAKPAIF